MTLFNESHTYFSKGSGKLYQDKKWEGQIFFSSKVFTNPYLNLISRNSQNLPHVWEKNKYINLAGDHDISTSYHLLMTSNTKINVNTHLFHN